MALSDALIALLRDESYASLGRGLAEAELAKIEANPPPGQPPPTRDVNASWWNVATDSSAASVEEQQWHERLTRFERFESWLQRRIRSELAAHLETTESDFQRLGRIQRLLNEWEFCVRRLLRGSVEIFVQALVALRELVESPGASAQSCAGALAYLRAAGVRLEQRDAQLSQISAAISGYSHVLGEESTKLPQLPSFRRVLWIDWLGVKRIDEIADELRSVETSMKAFLGHAFDEALARAQAARTHCVRQQEERLKALWAEGRRGLVQVEFKPAWVDRVLSGLAQRHGVDMAAGPGGVSADPFLARPQP